MRVDKACRIPQSEEADDRQAAQPQIDQCFLRRSRDVDRAVDPERTSDPTVPSADSASLSEAEVTGQVIWFGSVDLGDARLRRPYGARHWTRAGFADANSVGSMMSVGFTAIGIRLMLSAHSLRSEMLVAISWVSAEL